MILMQLQLLQAEALQSEGKGVCVGGWGGGGAFATVLCYSENFNI